MNNEKEFKIDNNSSDFIIEDMDSKLLLCIPAQERSIIFHDNNEKQIGKLFWHDGVFMFEGNVKESAKVFFDYIESFAKP